MSCRQRRGDSSAPALFPILAVFLCTIGALVLILVLTVSNSHASAKRDAENAMTDVKDTSDLMQVLSEELVAQRDDIKSKVERRRRDLADIEDHIARLTKSLDQLANKIDRIHSQVAETEADHSEKGVEIAKLRKEIDQKKKELVDEIEKQKKRKPAYAVIPYSGSNGTSRRPVYLECTRQGVVVQPEGLLISLQDLKPPFGPGNPLDAALRILRLAYQQKDATFGVALPPYPLLIVRPDGIHSYVLALEAMRGWDDQYGYELVDSEMELKFPSSPIGLKEQLTSTVEMAKRRQQALIASMPRRGAPQDRDESWDVIDASNDTHTTGGGNSSGMGDNIASKSETGTGLVAGNAAQQNWQLVQGLANSQVSNAIQKNGMESSQSMGLASNSMLKGNENSTGRNAFAMNGAVLSGQYAIGGGPNSASQTAMLQPGLLQAPADGQAFSENLLRPSTSPELANNSGGATEGSTAGSTAGASPSATTANSSTANSSTAGSNSDSGKGSPGSNAPSPPGANAFSSGTAASGGASGMAGGGASSMSASGSPAQSNPGAAPSLSVSMNQKTNSQPPKAKHVRPEGDLKPISVSAGHGWAASRAEGKATPVSRPINIVALKDRWLLRSDAEPNLFEVNVTMEEGPQQAGNQLAIAMRKRVDSWGLSVPGGYWSPTLTIEAANDAQQSVARLERLLDGSGVEIKVVPLTLPNRR